MAKRFNIHEWQAGRYSKKPLTEGKGSTLSISKSDMEKLHNKKQIINEENKDGMLSEKNIKS